MLAPRRLPLRAGAGGKATALDGKHAPGGPVAPALARPDVAAPLLPTLRTPM